LIRVTAVENDYDFFEICFGTIIDGRIIWYKFHKNFIKRTTSTFLSQLYLDLFGQTLLRPMTNKTSRFDKRSKYTSRHKADEADRSKYRKVELMRTHFFSLAFLVRVLKTSKNNSKLNSLSDLNSSQKLFRWANVLQTKPGKNGVKISSETFYSSEFLRFFNKIIFMIEERYFARSFFPKN